VQLLRRMRTKKKGENVRKGKLAQETEVPTTCTNPGGKNAKVRPARQRVKYKKEKEKPKGRLGKGIFEVDR